jgi:hypothetical protein
MHIDNPAHRPSSPVRGAYGPDPLWADGVDVVLARTIFYAKKPGGSMGGFVGFDPYSRRKLLVKEALSDRHAACETLANCLYRALAIQCPDVRWGTLEGDPVTLGPWVDGYGPVGDYARLPESDLDLIAGFFPADVWLANWDVIGMVYDNLLYDPRARGSRRFLHIDTGGALLFRAQGQSKGAAFGPSASEYENFTVPGKGSKSAYAVFGAVADVRSRRGKMLPMVRSIAMLATGGYVRRAARWAGFDADEALVLDEIMRARALDLADRVLHDPRK